MEPTCALSHFVPGLALHHQGRLDDAAFEAFDRVPVWNAYSTEHLRHVFPEALGSLRLDPRYERLLEMVNRNGGLETKQRSPRSRLSLPRPRAQSSSQATASPTSRSPPSRTVA